MTLAKELVYLKETQSLGIPIEKFSINGRELSREVTAGSFGATSSLVVAKDMLSMDLRKAWCLSRLRGTVPKSNLNVDYPPISIVDFFSGCGGLATGIKWACEAVGVRPIYRACVDVSRRSLGVYKKNLRPLSVIEENVFNLIDYVPSQSLDRDEHAHFSPILINSDISQLAGSIDLFIAGPPCEGNSNFNNKTRRKDRKNELYVAAVASAIALKARVVIIENVVTVKRSHQNVVNRALAMLSEAGYQIRSNDTILEASWFGTSQKRRRHFLIASKQNEIDVEIAFSGLRMPQISALEAIGDMVGIDVVREFDRPSELSTANKRRVKYLIDNNLHDLPDTERPDCHRTKPHTYNAVYGRIHGDKPVQTLTTGFLSPGRGRFTHPIEPRGLTLHEGARLQGFPDDFVFAERRGKDVDRQTLAHLIGDAVPPQLGYAVGLVALSAL